MNEITDIMLKLTDKCNLSCSYCYMHNKNNSDVSLNTTDNIIESINAISKTSYGRPLNVFVSGGEVTLLPVYYLDKFFSQLRNIPNLNISMNTNGTLFTYQHVAVCKKYNISISLSLDGHSEIHNRHRSNSFNLVMQAILKLKKAGIRFGLVSVIDNYSFNQKEELFDFFSRTKLDTKMNNADRQIPQKDYAEFMIWLYNKMKSGGHPFKEYHIEDIENTLNKKQSHCTECAWGNCYRNFIAIDHKGNVALCERFFGYPDRIKNKYLIGNINKHSIIKIIHSEIRYKQLEGLYLRKMKCSDCEYYSFCGSGCTYDIGIHGFDEVCEARKYFLGTIIGVGR